MKVGFVGLGSMGLPMAQRLQSAGHELTLYARRQASLEPFTGLDVSVAATPAAMGAQVEAVGVCVFDAAGVEEVLFGPEGLAATAAPGTVVLVHSTVSPAQVGAIAERAAGFGLRVLDAPVSGGAPRALAGELTVMVGGDAAALADVADLLAAFANHVVHLGGIGAASNAKLINNTLLAAQIALADEAMTAGRSLGVDPEGLASVLLTSSSSCVGSGVRLRAGSLAAVADSPAGPTLAKDVTLMAEVLAAAPGQDLVEVAQRLVTALRSGGQAQTADRTGADMTDTGSVVEKYGPWGVIAGGSDGVGIAFAHELAAHGVNVVLVARRESVLKESAEEVRAAHGVEVRTVALDLSAPGALADLAAATADLEVGLFVYNAGGDNLSVPFLDKDLDAHLALVQRNCISVLAAAHRFGGPMVARGRGGVVLVTSGAAWAGGATLATYGATKAFDLILAEGLWAEWQPAGVDVLALVLGRTDTPSLRRILDAKGEPHVGLADPSDVARQAVAHLGDGPTWIYGAEDPAGGSPFGALPRRQAVLTMSRGATASTHSSTGRDRPPAP